MKNIWKITAVLAVLMFMTVPVMAVTSWAAGEAYADENGAVVGTAAGSSTDTMSSMAGSLAIGDEVSSSSGTVGTESELYSTTEAEGVLVLGGASANVKKESAGVSLESDVIAGAVLGSMEAYSYATDETNDQMTAVGASAEGFAAGVEATGSATNWEGTATIETGSMAVFGFVSVGEISASPIDDAIVVGEAYASGLYAETYADVSAEDTGSDDAEATAGILAGAVGDETEITITGSAGVSFVEMSATSTAIGLGGAESGILSIAAVQEV